MWAGGQTGILPGRGLSPEPVKQVSKDVQGQGRGWDSGGPRHVEIFGEEREASRER